MPVVRINAPEWYLRPDWLAWISGLSSNFRRTGDGLDGPATWHRRGSLLPAAGSDVFFTYDDGDGSDSPQGTADPVIPEDIWAEIARVVKDAGINECLVWVSNLQE